jgi:hypothetical protein
VSGNDHGHGLATVFVMSNTPLSKLNGGWRPIAAIVVALIALLLAACGADAIVGPSDERPKTADELVVQTWQVMQGIQSYPFTGEVAIGEFGDGIERSSRWQLDGEGAGRDAYFVWQHSRRDDGTTVLTEWVSQDGLVPTRSPELRDRIWREYPAPFYRPLFTPGFSQVMGMEAFQWQEDTVIESEAVYHVTATQYFHVPDGHNVPLATFDLYIGQEDKVLRRMESNFDRAELYRLDREQPEEIDREVELATQDYYFFDFNEPITVQMPEEWVPLPDEWRQSQGVDGPNATPTPTAIAR